MPSSTNKGYELQVTGTNEDVWGDLLNSGVFEIIDRNLGGSVTKSLTNVNVDLDSTEGQNLRLTLNGTLTGNVLVRTPAVGMMIVQNNCTGSFTVTFARHNGGTTVGTPITLPNGTINLVAFGASGNPVSVGEEFASGTRLVFQQTAAPAGWTKDTTTSGLNNSAMRFVTGSVVNGGSQDFTTSFGSRALGGSVGSTVLSAGQMPAHRHFVAADADGGSTEVTASTRVANFGSWGGSSSVRYNLTGTATESTVGMSSQTGNNEGHNHSLSLNNLDINPRYFDCIIATKI